MFVEAYDHVQPIILERGREYGWFVIKDALELKLPPGRDNTLVKLQGWLEKR